MHSLMKGVGDNIRYARMRMKLTQLQLGKKIGISQYHVSRLEWGDQNLKIYLIFKLCKVLNIMPGELFDTDTPGRFYDGHN